MVAIMVLFCMLGGTGQAVAPDVAPTITEISCIIRAMSTTDSDGCRPPVPSHADQLFRRMASDFSGVPESVVALVWNQWTACSGIRKDKLIP
jgi:hypothetical protein